MMFHTNMIEQSKIAEHLSDLLEEYGVGQKLSS